MSDRVEGKYRIGAVARMTGLTTHALRVWQRRYGAVEPTRTGGGDRLFSDRDVERLRAIKRLVDLGHPVSRVARLDDEALFAELDPASLRAAERADGGPWAGRGEATAEVRRLFLAALAELDLPRAEDVLARAALLISPRPFLFDVVAPILTEVGERWEHGSFRVAHEHAASSLLRSLLGTVFRVDGEADAPLAIVTTLAGELHEFGALLAAMLAAIHRWRPMYLGPNLPVDDVVHALETSGADVLMLSFVNREDGNDEQVDDLLARLPADVGLVVGGGGTARVALRVRAHGGSVVGSLPDLERWMSRYGAARGAAEEA